MKMIVDREEEIKAFIPEEYWTVRGEARRPPIPPPFIAKLSKIDGKKAEVPNESCAREIETGSESGHVYVVEKIARKEKKQSRRARRSSRRRCSAPRTTDSSIP